MFCQLICFSCLLSQCVLVSSVTVYKNPDFFSELRDDFDQHLRIYDNFHRGNNEHDEYSNDDEDDMSHEHLESDEDNEYRYPGEPKRPSHSSVGGTSFDTNYDSSPEFQPPGRDVPFSKEPPKRGRGPYGHPLRHETNYKEQYDNDHLENLEKDSPTKFQFTVQQHLPNEEVLADDKKVGTREYQKLQSMKSKQQKQPKKGFYTCQTTIRKLPSRHRPRKYYVVPLNSRIVKAPPSSLRNGFPSPDYHGAYKLNSEFDLDYKNVRERSSFPYFRNVRPTEFSRIVHVNT